MAAIQKPDAGKFPAGIVVVLSLSMTLNTYSVGSLFSYVGLMVKDLLELDTTNESGFYAGYLGSAYMLGRFVGGYALGRVADFIGRKPVIISGLLSIAVFSLTFGLASTFGSAIASRFILGLTNGIAPALRTTLREVCGEEHVLQGMTYLGGSKAFSLVLGTGVGGLLAQPAVNYPDVFSDTGLFGRYPYLLPNLVGTCFALVLLPLVILFVPETRDFEEHGGGGGGSRGAEAETLPEETPDSGAVSEPPKAPCGGNLSHEELTDITTKGGPSIQRADALDHELHETDNDKDFNADKLRSADDEDVDVMVEPEEPGVWGPDGLLAVPHVKMVLFLALVVQALHIGFEEAFPLWALSTTDVGGLGWGSIEIGKAFLAAGLVVAALLLFVFPPAIKVLGMTTWQRAGCFVGVPAFIAIANAKALSWDNGSLFAVSVACTALIYCSQAMVTLSFVIASTSLVRSGMRGKLAGLYNAVESFGCFLGPITFANVFAWSISPSKYDWVDHRLVFYAAAFGMVVVAVLACGTITDERMTTSAEQRPGTDVPVACVGVRRKYGAPCAPMDVFRSASGEADLV